MGLFDSIRKNLPGSPRNVAKHLLKYYLKDTAKYPSWSSKDIFNKMLHDRYKVIKGMNEDEISSVVAKTDTLVELTFAVIANENPATLAPQFQKTTFDEVFTFFQENAPNEFNKFNSKVSQEKELDMSTHDITACQHCGTKNKIPRGKSLDKAICGKCKNYLIKTETSTRPSIDNEREFIEWMLRYDNGLEFFRDLFSNGFENMIKPTVEENMRLLNSCNNGEALLNKLGEIGEYHQKVLALIQKRGGINDAPIEMQSAYFDLTTKIAILPYFVELKYDMKLPQDIFDIRK